MSATRGCGATDPDPARTRASSGTGTACARSSGATDPDPASCGARTGCGTAAVAAVTVPATATASSSGCASAGGPAAPTATSFRERQADIGDALHRGDEWNGNQYERERHDEGS